MCRFQHWDTGSGGDAARLGLKQLSEADVDWGRPQGRRPLYYWYYVTQALFYAGGDAWARWDPAFANELVANQACEVSPTPGEPAMGYWNSPAASENHGRVYSTTLCTLMLEVYYRYLPSYSALVEGHRDSRVEFEDTPLVTVRCL